MFGLYLATLQPDFGGPEDTPKFQFLGYVLGTAHPPGYRLYSWLSHLFVTAARIGTVAYRADLFSAVMAALACALAFVLGRQIGAERRASVCAALALGAGVSFWRSAVFAEVYSLAAVIVAATMALLLAWNGRSRPGLLLGATGMFALGLGNHLTIVGLVPACVLYVLIRNRRVLTPAVVAAASILLAAGVAQYGLILVRTHQAAPYFESRASSVRELVGVVTAERYAGQRFAFGPWVLLSDHLPAIARVIGHELRIAGVVLTIAGLTLAIRERASGVALLAAAGAGLLFMVLNLEGDLAGFVTPIMVVLWPIAAFGITALARTLRASPSTRAMAPAAALVAAAILPIVNVTANYAGADQSAHTGAARFFRTLFRELPDGAGIVADNYFDDMAIHYMTLTGEGGRPRGIRRLPFDTDTVRAAHHSGLSDGRPRRVFAFAGGALFLGTAGLQFERTAIPGPTFEDWLDSLPRGTVVVAASSYTPAPADPPGRVTRMRDRQDALAGTSICPPGRGQPAAWRGGDEGASLVVDPPPWRRPLRSPDVWSSPQMPRVPASCSPVSRSRPPTPASHSRRSHPTAASSAPKQSQETNPSGSRPGGGLRTRRRNTLRHVDERRMDGRLARAHHGKLDRGGPLDWFGCDRDLTVVAVRGFARPEHTAARRRQHRDGGHRVGRRRTHNPDRDDARQRIARRIPPVL